MPDSIDDLIPNAKQIRKEAALKEAEKAEEYVRLAAAAEAEKRALIERLSKPSGKSEEEKIQLASTVIQRAVRNGLTEVQVYRFPNSLCTDKGRAINQQETGLGEHTDGDTEGNLPALDRLPEAAGLSHRLPDHRFPGGMPGDIGITIAWGRLMQFERNCLEIPERDMTADKPPERMKRKAYEKALEKLQVELCHLQEWVKANKLRVIVLFEGRDAAGKGGTIKAITEKVSPRVFRVVALAGAVGPREDTALLPALHGAISGRRRDRDLRPELVQSRRRRICDGLLYARRARSLSLALPPDGEIRHRRRHHPDQDLARGRDGRAGAPLQGPHRRSAAAMEAESDGPGILRRWYDYSQARDLMLKKTSTKHAPWYIIRSDDKRRARLNCIAHVLKSIPHKRIKKDKVKLPKRSDKGRYNDQAGLRGMNFVAERY